MQTQSYNTVIDTITSSTEILKADNATKFSCPTISFKLVTPESVKVEIGWPVGGLWPQIARIMDALFHGDLDDQLHAALMRFAIDNPMEASNASDLQAGFRRLFESRDAILHEKLGVNTDTDDVCVDPEETIAHNLSFPGA